MITQEIRNEVATLTTSQVYVGEAHETALMPYIVIDQLNGNQHFSHDGNNSMNEGVVDVSIWGRTYPEAKELAHTIKQLLSYKSDTVRIITLENEQDLISNDKFGVVLAFYIRWLEGE